MLWRALSLGILLACWQLGALAAGPHALPAPWAVAERLWAEARSGALAFHMSVTLARVGAAFVIAMALGTAIGFAMGRDAWLDRLVDPWLVLFLNLPALVIIVLAYVWIGLNEIAAIGAVALNKLPNAIVAMREGAKALDPQYDELAEVFALPAWTRLRHILAPQLAPYFAASARSGLSLVWKIVLVVELMGRSNGIGFQMNVAFQLFDMTMLLAYALPFVGVMLAIEFLLVQPFERRVSRWRPRAA
jgi:NitT/TauT family transport system permease protein